MTTYPAQIEQQGGEFVVRFPDVPEALTGGSSLAEALELAPDALAAAAEGYLQAGRPFPAPRPTLAGEYDVPLAPDVQASLSRVA